MSSYLASFLATGFNFSALTHQLESTDESGPEIKLSVRYKGHGNILHIQFQSSTDASGFVRKESVPTNFTLQAITLACEKCEKKVSETVSSRRVFIPFDLAVEMPETEFSSLRNHRCPEISCSRTVIEVHLRRYFDNNAMLLKMLEEAHFSDVALRVEGQELPAHRAVLAASSPVFRALFQHEDFPATQPGVVEVQGVRVEVVRAALRFLYGQQLQQADTDLDTLLDLLKLAERYQLLPLKAQCEELLSYVEERDLIKVLAVADTHNAPDLKEELFRRFADHPDKKSLMGRAAALELNASHPELFVDLMLKSVSNKDS